MIEKEYEPGGWEYDNKKKKWVHESDCFELDLKLEGGYEKELCVSERVFNDAMLDHQITLTKEYN